MKKSLFLMMLIILLLTSCTRSPKHGPPIVAGVYDSLEILIGYSEDTLEQVDYILFEDSNSNGQRAYNYEFDRGMLLFNGDSFYVNITYDRNETYHNKTILDDLRYDFIWIKSSERMDRED